MSDVVLGPAPAPKKRVRPYDHVLVRVSERAWVEGSVADVRGDPRDPHCEVLLRYTVVVSTWWWSQRRVRRHFRRWFPFHCEVWQRDPHREDRRRAARIRKEAEARARALHEREERECPTSSKTQQLIESATERSQQERQSSIACACGCGMPLKRKRGASGQCSEHSGAERRRAEDKAMAELAAFVAERLGDTDGVDLPTRGQARRRRRKRRNGERCWLRGFPYETLMHGTFNGAAAGGGGGSDFAVMSCASEDGEEAQRWAWDSEDEAAAQEWEQWELDVAGDSAAATSGGAQRWRSRSSSEASDGGECAGGGEEYASQWEVVPDGETWAHEGEWAHEDAWCEPCVPPPSTSARGGSAGAEEWATGQRVLGEHGVQELCVVNSVRYNVSLPCEPGPGAAQCHAPPGCSASARGAVFEASAWERDVRAGDALEGDACDFSPSGDGLLRVSLGSSGSSVGRSAEECARDLAALRELFDAGFVHESEFEQRSRELEVAIRA